MHDFCSRIYQFPTSETPWQQDLFDVNLVTATLQQQGHSTAGGLSRHRVEECHSQMTKLNQYHFALRAISAHSTSPPLKIADFRNRGLSREPKQIRDKVRHLIKQKKKSLEAQKKQPETED